MRLPEVPLRSSAYPHIDLFRAATTQGFGQLVERASRGHDIVDEGNVARRPPGQLERAAQVTVAGAGAKACLRRRGANAYAGVEIERATELSGQGAGDLDRLIEAALTLAGRMQRHRQDRVRPWLVAQPFGEKDGEGSRQMYRLSELQLQHQGVERCGITKQCDTAVKCRRTPLAFAA